MREGKRMLRGIGLPAALAVAALAVVPVAGADAGSPNYSSKLMSVAPAVKGLTLRVVDGDDAIELQNRTGKNIRVPGYENEPYLRFLAGGRVEVNVRSPAKYLNEERYGGVTVPKEADPKAKPEWQLVAEGGSYTWHEHRIHWMSTEQPPRVKASGGDTFMKVFDWVVPLQVGARRVKASGTLWWVPTGQLARADALIAAAVKREARQTQAQAAKPTTTGAAAGEPAPATTAAAEAEAAAAPGPATEVASGGGSAVLWVVIAVLALCLLGALAYVLRLRRHGEAPGPPGEVW